MCKKEDYKGVYELFKKDESLVKRLDDTYEDKEVADANILWILTGFWIRGMNEEANQFNQAVKKYLQIITSSKATLS